VIFAHRGKRGPDPYLATKVQLFFVAAAVALVGIALESSWLVGIAILLLLVGVVFRLLSPKSPVDGDPSRGGDVDGVEEGPGPF
jgi:hypothetical protein